MATVSVVETTRLINTAVKATMTVVAQDTDESSEPGGKEGNVTLGRTRVNAGVGEVEGSGGELGPNRGQAYLLPWDLDAGSRGHVLLSSLLQKRIKKQVYLQGLVLSELGETVVRCKQNKTKIKQNK